jgi:hypothetical protein
MKNDNPFALSGDLRTSGREYSRLCHAHERNPDLVEEIMHRERSSWYRLPLPARAVPAKLKEIFLTGGNGGSREPKPANPPALGVPPSGGPSECEEVFSTGTAVGKSTASFGVPLSGRACSGGPQTTNRLEEIALEVAAAHGLAIDQLRKKSRVWRFSYPRQMAMFLQRALTGASLPQIGAWWGMNHGTVHHALAAMRDRCEAHPDTGRICNDLRAKLSGQAFCSPRSPR